MGTLQNGWSVLERGEVTPWQDSPKLHSAAIDSETTSGYGYGAEENQDWETPFGEVIEEGQVPAVQQKVKVGNTSLPIANALQQQAEEYQDPSQSGNPLLVISSADRQLRIADNFMVGEFAQAQGGKVKWAFARIDPLLVDNLQRLRIFLGKEVQIIDGYYSVKYLKQVLKVTDPQRISRNPHLGGRGAKITVKGYEGNMIQIAMAAIVACDRNINVGIGNSTLTLYVKQSLHGNLPENAQRITSYLANEKIRVQQYRFCIDFKNLLHNKNSAYEKAIRKATAIYLREIMALHYQQIPLAGEWKSALRDVISLLYEQSQTKNPQVLLYCLAYSSFGDLYRFYNKDQSAGKINTITRVTEELTSPNDRTHINQPGSFLYAQKHNPAQFVQICYSRYVIGRANGTFYQVVPGSFFDWKYNKSDEAFWKAFSAEIKEVYQTNRYPYQEAIEQLPEGGTVRELKLADPNPDQPKFDFTGRYGIAFPQGHADLWGRYLLINQAGNHVSGKLSGVYKKSVKNLRNTILHFYGEMNADGIVIGAIYPQKTFVIRKAAGNKLLFAIINNPTDTVELKLELTQLVDKPVISSQVLDALIRQHAMHQDMMITLAWVPLPPGMMKALLDTLKKSEQEIEGAISDYYHVEEGMPSVRKASLRKAVKRLSDSYKHLLPPMYHSFGRYYTQFYHSVSDPWRPRKDREYMSRLGWIRRMLRDWRDLQGSNYIVQHHRELYEDFDMDTQVPTVVYAYEVNMVLVTRGVGPFARTDGRISIENKTDYKKYPGAERWKTGSSKVDYHISFWSGSLAISVEKWRPKIAARVEVKAAGTSPIPYLETDFSGADVDMTEWTAFDVSVAGLGASLTKRNLTINGLGKRPLQLDETDIPILPDTFTIDPDGKAKNKKRKNKIFDFSLPGVTFYDGEIHAKAVGRRVVEVPVPQDFEARFQLKSTSYFKHDSGILSPDAIRAVGRMCAEELFALSDPDSELEIYGHTDPSGKPDYNLTLSAVRAANTLQAIEDRLGKKFKVNVKKVAGLGEHEANSLLGTKNSKNAWFRRVIILINGRAVLTLGQL